ncbi:MAG TPA: hypothetical protein VJ901_08440 [Thermoanaerobaculia bacterium]|nr:hypothetical protein [Thermoanaerobaculia bacterium]
MKRILVVLAASIALLGCATTYEPSDFSGFGGFTETRLGPNTYRVLVEGNGFTSRNDVEQFAMRRCAELTLEQGKRYFVLERHRAWVDRRVSRDGVADFPRNEAVMTAVTDKERDTFDAASIIDETNAIAKGRLSAKAKDALMRINS